MFELIFDTKFDCIIALNSKLPPLSFFVKYFQHTPIIGADGGAVNLFDIGIVCDYVVGDLDTFRKANIDKYFQNRQIVFNPDQEINDFEKALLFAEKKLYKNILVIGFHGGELEHTLNNWSIIKKYQDKINLCIYDNGRYAIPIYYSFTLKCKKNEMISLIPQPKVKVKTKNLKWNLNNETLELGIREGARNVATDEFFEIEVYEGSLLLFIEARVPNCFRKQKNKSGPDETRTHDL